MIGITTERSGENPKEHESDQVDINTYMLGMQIGMFDMKPKTLDRKADMLEKKAS